MLDLVFVGVSVLFFVVSIGVCGRMRAAHEVR